MARLVDTVVLSPAPLPRHLVTCLEASARLCCNIIFLPSFSWCASSCVSDPIGRLQWCGCNSTDIKVIASHDVTLGCFFFLHRSL